MAAWNTMALAPAPRDPLPGDICDIATVAHCVTLSNRLASVVGRGPRRDYPNYRRQGR